MIPITGVFKGLTEEQAAALRARYGYNELPAERRVGLLRVILSVLREPMIILLFVSALIYFLLGDHTEALLLIGSALLVLSINIIQDVRSERALQALKQLTAPRAMVVRSGNAERVAAREIVPQDILIVSEGDRIAADAEIVEETNLLVDESLITGESLPVEKSVRDEKSASEHERYTLLSGTLVVRGSGMARVTATGASTEIGKIGTALNTASESKTPLELQTLDLVKYSAFAGIGVCVLTILLYGITRGAWIEACLAGVALMMSLLPEEFPVILSIFLALGARRLSRQGILIRQMPAVEALGTVTTLCVDKTGTLTMNQMTLVELATSTGELFKPTKGTALATAYSELLQLALLATKPAGFDPMDRAVRALAEHYAYAQPPYELVDELPISPELPVFANFWKYDSEILIAAKGAPEAILRLCHITDVDVSRYATINSAIEHLARRGLRVLAVCSTTVSSAQVEGSELQKIVESNQFTFQGLLAFADPLREGIREAIDQSYSAGIRVVMITGDYPITARSIAHEAGIRNAEEILTGSELETLEEGELERRAHTTNVFARVTPMQKLRIVELLKRAGEIVVMTGDGVNDAPALKAAHIGVAMGERGTDVAREASKVVLTKDDFPSLVSAVRMGRRTYDNIKKAMYYVLAIHFPIAGLSLLPLIVGSPLIFLPIHIVLLELIIDPVSSIVFEAEPGESNIMQRPPRDPLAPVFQKHNIVVAALQGVSIFIVCGGIYLYFYFTSHSEFEARTLSFATLVLSNLGLALVDRSWSRTFFATLHTTNTPLWLSMAAGVSVLLVITQVPVLSRLFHFGPFHLHDWLICGIAAAFSLTWFELLKLVVKRPMIV